MTGRQLDDREPTEGSQVHGVSVDGGIWGPRPNSITWGTLQLQRVSVKNIYLVCKQPGVLVTTD